MEMPHPTRLPEVFAIDEFKGNTGAQNYQCILTDPAHGRVLDILPDRRSSHLIEYLRGYDRLRRLGSGNRSGWGKVQEAVKTLEEATHQTGNEAHKRRA